MYHNMNLQKIKISKFRKKKNGNTYSGKTFSCEILFWNSTRKCPRNKSNHFFLWNKIIPSKSWTISIVDWFVTIFFNFCSLSHFGKKKKKKKKKINLLIYQFRLHYIFQWIEGRFWLWPIIEMIDELLSNMRTSFPKFISVT